MNYVTDREHSWLLKSRGNVNLPSWIAQGAEHEVLVDAPSRGTRLIIQRLADYVWLLQKPDAANPRNSDE